MSVINQMLKDLEQRSPEHGQAPITVVTAEKRSTFKIILLTVVVLLSLNALAFYIWDLQGKLESSQELNENKQASTISKYSKQELAQKIPQKLAQESISKPKNEQVLPVSLSEESKPEKMLTLETTQRSESVIAKPSDITKQITKTKVSKVPNVTKVLSETKETKEAKVSAVIHEHKEVKASEPPRMTVARRQLTATELVSQKLANAEKALNLNDITKAEHLFEDVLIIEPANKQARKKLAALWFGRKSYQQALNLLSQGISIDHLDGELRLLKARIHLNQGQKQAAYKTLQSLPDYEQEEYQVTLANIAQQIEQYASAISAYKVLINMQPYSGRWHLGLAIIYDKHSQFVLAKKEYTIALTKADLSASSVKFAEQRMQALGE